MLRLRFIIVLAIVSVALATAGLSWADDELLLTGDAITDSSILHRPDHERLNPQQLIELENEYSRRLETLARSVGNESDPFKQETLQKKIQEIKVQREIEIKKMQMAIAVEQGDKIREKELFEALQSFYKTPATHPSSQEPSQKPEPENIHTKPPSKNPDDA